MSSRKLEQRRIKEEKQEASRRREQRNGLLTKVAAAVLIPLVLFVLWQGLTSGPQSQAPDAVSEADHVRGNPAGVTVTVYADFQCPACKVEEEMIARGWSELSDKVKLVFRHYPLGQHRHAFLAARYAEAAGRQGQFWPMHDRLFANQELWTNLTSVDEIFDGYAQEIGLDLAQLKADIDLPEIRDKIVADQKGGTRAGVRATPSVFVNGRLVSTPRTVTELMTLVDQAARESGGVATR